VEHLLRWLRLATLLDAEVLISLGVPPEVLDERDQVLAITHHLAIMARGYLALAVLLVEWRRFAGPMMPKPRPDGPQPFAPEIVHAQPREQRVDFRPQRGIRSRRFHLVHELLLG